MQIKCVIIDDEPLALELIREYVSRFPELTIVKTYTDALSAFDFLNSNSVDLLFIDINMPHIDGIRLVRSLKEKPMIIFTTAHRKFALEGFELDAIDYLLKPIRFDRFSRAIQKAIDYAEYKDSLTKKDSGQLFVYSEYRLIKIDLDEVEYFESLEDYVKIHFTHQKPILTLMTLKKIYEKLPQDKFRRIHRSYIVAVDKVRSIQNRKAKLSDTELPISDSYSSFISEWMKK